MIDKRIASSTVWVEDMSFACKMDLSRKTVDACRRARWLPVDVVCLTKARLLFLLPAGLRKLW